MNRILFTTIAVIIATTSAHADPGHGAGVGIVHFLTEPDHLAILSAALIGGFFLYRHLKRA